MAEGPFHDVMLPERANHLAPDGSEVREMARLAGGTMAHFTLPPGASSKAVVHRTVEEIWFILSGSGRMWRRGTSAETVTALRPRLSLTIPLGTAFQFRNDGEEPLTAVAITMPPWPGADEAVFVDGIW
jgi:mannose-6-phosphate isomerase-like protein (cupin superfamily)